MSGVRSVFSYPRCIMSHISVGFYSSVFVFHGTAGCFADVFCSHDLKGLCLM